MLIKLIGGLAIIISGVWWGLIKSNELKLRVESLENIKAALGVLESEISFSSHYLKDAFLRIERLCPCGELFGGTAEKMKRLPVRDAWCDTLVELSKGYKLKQSDVDILKTFSAELGKSDKEQQIKNIHRITELLKVSVADAREEYKTMAKLYRSTGILTGLFIVIILL